MPQPSAYPATDTGELTSDDVRDAPTVVAAARHWAAFVPRDPAWKAAARELPSDARRALLELADAAWKAHWDTRGTSRNAGDDAGLLAASGTYDALAAELDPSDPADCARVRRLIRSGSAIRSPALMEATVARGTEPETKALARVVLAHLDLVQGRHDAAEAALVDVLRAAEPEQHLLRGLAAMSYARICLDMNRDLEALVLARRAGDSAQRAGDIDGALFSRMVEANVLLHLEDWPRLRAAIEDYAAQIDGAPPLLQLRLRGALADISADFAAGEERWEDAIVHRVEAERLWTNTPNAAASVRRRERTEALASLGRGDPDGALREIGRAIEAAARDPWDVLPLSTRRVRVLAAQRSDDVGRAAAEWLDLLEGAAGVSVSHGLVLRAAQDGAAALRMLPEHAEITRRAYRVAASAALVRLAEIERFVREFPDYATPTPEERATIEDFRRRTEEREASLREAVASLLQDEIRAGRWPLESLAADGALVACCAWCGRMRNRGGAWLPMPETLHALPQNVVAMTHAICADCTREVCADVA